MNPVNKIALVLITFFFGGLGGHKLYVKKFGQGIVYLLFSWTGIPSLIALIEFIMYLIKSEEDLQAKYPDTLSAGATAGALIGVLIGFAVLIAVLMMVLAAIGFQTPQ